VEVSLRLLGGSDGDLNRFLLLLRIANDGGCALRAPQCRRVPSTTSPPPGGTGSGELLLTAGELRTGPASSRSLLVLWVLVFLLVFVARGFRVDFPLFPMAGAGRKEDW